MLVTVVDRLASRGCEPLCVAHFSDACERHLSVPSSARHQKPFARLLHRECRRQCSPVGSESHSADVCYNDLRITLF